MTWSRGAWGGKRPGALRCPVFFRPTRRATRHGEARRGATDVGLHRWLYAFP